MERRTGYIAFRVTDDEHDAIRRAANDTRVSVAAYVRAAYTHLAREHLLSLVQPASASAKRQLA